MHGKAGIAVSPLALSACQGVLVFGLGVQEYRKVLAHLLVAQLQQFFGPAPTTTQSRSATG